MTTSVKYAIRLHIEWGDGCLWPADDATTAAFGAGPLDRAGTRLPLSPEMVRRCEELTAWHATSLDLAFPSEPSPWRQPECDRFNEAVRDLLAAVRAELGEQFEVTNTQPEVFEGMTWTSVPPSRPH